MPESSFISVMKSIRKNDARDNLWLGSKHLEDRRKHCQLFSLSLSRFVASKPTPRRRRTLLAAPAVFFTPRRKYFNLCRKTSDTCTPSRLYLTVFWGKLLNDEHRTTFDKKLSILEIIIRINCINYISRYIVYIICLDVYYSDICHSDSVAFFL